MVAGYSPSTFYLTMWFYCEPLLLTPFFFFSSDSVHLYGSSGQGLGQGLDNMAEFDAIFHYITWVFHHFVFPLKFKFSNELASSKIKVKIDEKVLPFLHKFKTWQRYQILIDRKIILKEVSIKTLYKWSNFKVKTFRVS